MGYSLICWIIGVTAYIGGFYYFVMVDDGVTGRTNEVYKFYVMMALPIVIAVGITAVLLRPFYLIMVSKFYTDVIPLHKDASTLTLDRKFNALALVFSIMLCVLLAMYFFGDQLGVRAWVERLAQMDFTGQR